MRKRNQIIYSFILSIFSIVFNTVQAQDNNPNIVLITLDDMNWDSPASYGGIIKDLTPNIDGLAEKGILFKNAYVQAPNCSPSRSVIQTGLYPHQTGLRGFYYVKDNFNTLPEILKNNGYFTGVLNKTADSSINPNFDEYWDVYKSISGKAKRSASKYADIFRGFIDKVENSKKPFYCVVNIADPHKPFFNDKSSSKKGFNDFAPSKVYTMDDVKIPNYLPNHPKIKQEVLNYYNSVKRGDDCVGEVLKVLKNSKFQENTIVILLSDHGAPFPFAKSSLYQNGVKTPLIITNLKGKSSAKTNTSMVSAVDIAPTILDILDISIPEEFAGKSFYKTLMKENTDKEGMVFTQFDENAGGIPRPSRSVITKKYGYIFNPWATGKYKFQSASTWHTSYKVMNKMSVTNEEVAKRFNHWKYRAVEELYDYENDPDALHSLIDDPKYADVINDLQHKLLQQMKSTNDYVLKAFEQKTDTTFLNNWMKEQEILAENRRTSIKWKRGKNASGSTKNNVQLYSSN